ncbi:MULTISPECIES: hypothetical protein [unclassified Mesorhizobium]|uniref:hypothetical protein n=1 Tax=unclassified Mesorhizobium TaxID=325217 RepID=UPI000FD6FAEF|nr:MULTISPECIES: hypothetical protein [unclassified Mesorhizobium]TGT76718.1 hypothetical protein EN809_003690 [Mesorhizobium sp. M2E.F.Ca.ET.166.01.1.1]TGW02830.1 hypothetical protein EN797_003690 [Mesorhizobium sp. M2E.F.Ca.ET.154.01.1.1]
MNSVFEVTTPNLGGLLTVDEARAALGLTDSSRDADLTRLIARVSASIFRACKVKSDGVNPPTLLSEAVTETFQVNSPVSSLQLSRRRVTGTLTVTQNDAALDDSAFYIDRASGILSQSVPGLPYRFNVNTVPYWPKSVVTVDYTAGFLTVPDDLKLAAEYWLRVLWRDSYQTPSALIDPTLKSEEIPGVINRTWWVDPTKQSLLPDEIREMLKDGGYVETWIA